MVEPRIAVRELEVRAGSQTLAGPLSFDVARASLTALVGPNGSGKTSVLRAIAGLASSNGSVLLDGTPLHSLQARERARLLAYVPQQSSLDAALSVGVVVATGRFAYGGAAPDDPRVVDALRRTSTLQLASRSFPSLSLGEQRRVLLARALATGAKTVLLDEPDAYLDVGQRVRLFALLEELRDEGTTLLVVVHSLDEARRHADACVVLERGALVGAGEPTTILSEKTLRSVFEVGVEESAAPRFILPRGGL